MAENPREQQNSLLSETMDVMREVMRYAPLSQMEITTKKYQAELKNNPNVWREAIRQQFPYVRFVTEKNKIFSVKELKDVYTKLCMHVQASALAKFARFDAQNITSENLQELMVQHQNAEASHVLDEKKKDPICAGYLPIIKEFEYPGLAYMPPVDLFMLVAQNPGIFLDGLVQEQDEGLIPSHEYTISKRIAILSDFVPNHFGLAPENDGDYRNLYAHIVLANIAVIEKHSLLSKLTLPEMSIFMDLACRLGRVDVVNLLMAKDCEPSGAYLGRSFVGTACQFAHKSVVESLVSNIDDKKRKTFFDEIAFQNGLAWEVLAAVVNNPVECLNKRLLNELVCHRKYALIKSMLQVLGDPASERTWAFDATSFLITASRIIQNRKKPVIEYQEFWECFQEALIPLGSLLFEEFSDALQRIDREHLVSRRLLKDVARKISPFDPDWFARRLANAINRRHYREISVLISLFPSDFKWSGDFNLSALLNQLNIARGGFDSDQINNTIFTVIRILLISGANPDEQDHTLSILHKKPKSFLINVLWALQLHTTPVRKPYLYIAMAILKHTAVKRTCDQTKKYAAGYPEIQKLLPIYLEAYKARLQTEQACVDFIFTKLQKYSGYGATIPAVGRFFSGRPNTTFGEDVANLLQTPSEQRTFAVPFKNAGDVQAFFSAMESRTASRPMNPEGEFSAIKTLAEIMFCENSLFLEKTPEASSSSTFVP